MSNGFVDSLNHIGAYLPIILPFIAYFGLNNKLLALLLILDPLIINPSLKRILGLLNLQSKRPLCKDMHKYESFGLPSGHTEVHWILLTYLVYLSVFSSYKADTKSLALLCIVSAMTALVMWQRWYSRMHSPIQILVGALVGFTIGSTFIYFTHF